MNCQHSRIKSFNKKNAIEVKCDECGASQESNHGSHEEALASFLVRHKDSKLPAKPLNNIENLTER